MSGPHAPSSQRQGALGSLERGFKGGDGGQGLYFQNSKRVHCALDLLHPQLLPLANNSKLKPISPLEGSVVVVVVVVFLFFLSFPFPFSAFVAHLLQSTSLQEPKLNKLPICHASLVVCSPHRHLAYLLSQKEKEREKEQNQEGGGGRRRESRARRGRSGEKRGNKGGGQRRKGGGREGGREKKERETPQRRQSQTQ